MTFCNHLAFGVRLFCKKRKKTDFSISQNSNKRKIKKYLNKNLRKKHVKEFILSKGAGKVKVKNLKEGKVKNLCQ